MATGLTESMRLVERRFAGGLPLPVFLCKRFNEVGLPELAAEICESKSTVWYWLLKFHIEIKHVAILPDEVIEIKKKG